MKPDSAEKRAQILAAAAEVFARYGFNRTSMADIAAAARVSRPALYLLFQNKEDVFRTLSEALLDRSLGATAEALAAKGSLRDRVTNALLAYEEHLFELVATSPHGVELVDTNAKLAGEATQRARARLVKLVANAIRDAETCGEAKLTPLAIRPKDFAELLVAAVTGFKHDPMSVPEFRRRVQAVSGIFIGSIARPRAKIQRQVNSSRT